MKIVYLSKKETKEELWGFIIGNKKKFFCIKDKERGWLFYNMKKELMWTHQITPKILFNLSMFELERLTTAADENKWSMQF
jgi:hypothetical protein